MNFRIKKNEFLNGKKNEEVLDYTGGCRAFLFLFVSVLCRVGWRKVCSLDLRTFQAALMLWRHFPPVMTTRPLPKMSMTTVEFCAR